MRPPPPCADCGPDPVRHASHRMGITLARIITPLTVAFDEIWRIVGPALLLLPLARLASLSLSLLARIGIATETRAPDSRDSLRTRALWESAARKGIDLLEFRLFRLPELSVFVARAGGKIRVFDGLPRPERIPARSVRWMDNKAVMKRRFTAAGIPVARGGVARSVREARTIFSRFTPPMIAKPHLGSRSRHTTVHIRDLPTLETAFSRAKQLSPSVVIEEELVGDIYRGTLIGGKVAGVIRRELPHILADGHSTVRELIERENQNPQRRGPIFHELPMGPEAIAELARQGYTLDSVPKKGTVVTVSQKVSRAFGASTTDVTGETHPETKVLLERIAAVLKDSLVGVDFIVPDITKPIGSQARAGVIECNSLPFLDLHHYPLVGTPRDAAAMLWDFVFPKQNR